VAVQYVGINKLKIELSAESLFGWLAFYFPNQKSFVFYPELKFLNKSMGG
jgi:hypothetical protein